MNYDGPRESSTPSDLGAGKVDNSPADGPVEKHFLRLYVAGATARSHQALLRARKLCEAEFKHNYELEVIDVYQSPEIAHANLIVATPMLVVEFPPPVLRFIGGLAKKRRFFAESQSKAKTGFEA